MENEKPRQTVLIYSDEGVLSTGAASLLSSMPQFDVVVAESDLAGLIPLAERTAPDVILLRLNSTMTLALIATLRHEPCSGRSQDQATHSGPCTGMWGGNGWRWGAGVRGASAGMSCRSGWRSRGNGKPGGRKTPSNSVTKALGLVTVLVEWMR